MTHPKKDSWILEIQKDWSRLQVDDHLRKLGLSLSAQTQGSDNRLSAAESLVVCLIQHLSGRYSSLTQIQDAVEIIFENESDQIRFRLRLSEKRFTTGTLIEPFVKDVLHLLQHFDNSTVTVISSHGIIKIGSEDGRDLLLWQDGSSGLFSCISERKNMFDDAEDYALALLGDIPLIRDLLFRHLEEIEDEAVEKAALDLRDEFESCQTPADYLATINQCTIEEGDTWKLIALEQLIVIGRLSETAERDLREEIFDCLARASEETYLRRKKDYEMACQNDLERQNEKERHNCQLKQEMEAAQKEIAQLEAHVKETLKIELEVENEYKKQQSKAGEKRDQELQAKRLLDHKSAESEKKLEEIRKKKAETEAEIKRIKNEEKRTLEQAKKVSDVLEHTGIELDSVGHTMQNRRDRLESGQESLASLEEKQRKLTLQEQQLISESQTKIERKHKESQILNSNQARIQQLKAKKEQNAWREFQVTLARSVPPYQLVSQKSSFLKRVKGVDRPDHLFELIKTEFKLNMKNYSDLIAYAQNTEVSKASILKEVRNTVVEMLAEPRNDFIRQPWRITGDALLLSQVRDQLPNKYCEEIQICASRVIYVDCDWTVPGVDVALSAPQIQVIGKKRQISTSGRDAEEFSNKQANNAVRKGENGDHGKNGAAGESAGNFWINCAHLSGGHLHVVADGGDGADGQDGGDGRQGQDGSDGDDGEITDRPSEGIGIINSGFRSSDNLKRYARGKFGTPGQTGGCGGNGGAGGEGGCKGTVSRTITKTWEKNFTSNAEDGHNGRDGQPGQGAPGGWGGMHGRDRALVFQPSGPLGLAVTGSWEEDCGDLVLGEYKNIFGAILGFRIIKRGENNGRASRGDQGENGKKADQRQRSTAKAKKQITNVQHVWNSDVVEDQQQSSSSDTIDDELTQLEATNRRIQDEMTKLDQQEAVINKQLKLVEQQKSTVKQNKMKESSVISDLQRETRQLEEQRRRIKEAMQQQKESLTRNQKEAQALKTTTESRKVEVAQLARSEKELNATSTREKSQMKAVVSQLTEEAKLAEKAAEKTRQAVDNIKSERSKTERTVEKEKRLIGQRDKMMNQNKRGMEEDRQHRIETEEKLNKLDGMDQIKDKILKKARIVKQHQAERIGIMEDNGMPDMRSDVSWPSDLGDTTEASNFETDEAIVGFQLLDALVEKFATTSSSKKAMMEKSVLLAALSQQTAMLISNPDSPWPSSMTSIIREAEDDIDSLIEALKCINADLQLVQLIDSSNSPETKQLMTSLRKHVATKSAFVEEKGETAMVFYQFRKLSSSCQEIMTLLEHVEKFKTSDIADRLKDLLCGKLLVLIAKRIVVDAKKVDDRISWVQMLLADTLDYCLENNPEAKLKMSSFYLKLTKMLDEKKKKKKEQTWDDMEKALMEFVLKQLALDLDKTSADKINREQILFILRHAPNVGPAVLDKLLQWSVDNKDEEMTHSIEQVFDERHWKPIWNTIRSVKQSEEEVKRMEAALGWKYCSLSSYKEKMQVCSELGEKLRSTAIENPAEFKEWIEKQETEISGCRFEDASQLKSSFLQFFRQLSTEFANSNNTDLSFQAKKKLTDFMTQKVLGQTPENALNAKQKIKRALYIYNKIPFGCTDEIKELYQLFETMDSDITKMSKNMKGNDRLSLLKDWSDLKKEHRTNWATNFLRRWTDDKISNNKMQMEEIARIKAEIQDRSSWPSSSRMIVKTLLLKYLYITSKSLSPSQSLKDWQSLAKMTTDKPDKLREEIQKRIADTRFGKFSSVRADQFVTMMDEFVKEPTATAHQKLEELFKSQINWTDQDVALINERLSHWEMTSSNDNKMVKTLLDMLASNEALLKELDASVEANYLELTTVIESLCKDVLRMVSFLRSAVDLQQEKNDNILVDFVAHLDDNQAEMNVSELHKKRTTMQHYFVNCCVKLAKIPINAGQKDPAVLVTKLLELCSTGGSNHEETTLRLTIVVELCEKLELSSIATTKEWTNMLERVSASCRDGVLKVQWAIIRLCQSFCLSDENSQDDLMAMDCEHRIDEWTIISEFLAGSDIYQTNRLLLYGLLTLAEDQQNKRNRTSDRKNESAEEFMLRLIEKIRNDKNFGSLIKKTAIAAFIYSPELSTPTESVFLKRLIQTEASMENKNIAIVYDLIKKQEKSGILNRFWSRLGDILTPEEEQYVDVIGREAATQLLQDETPVQYLQYLQEITAKQMKDQLTLHCRSSNDTEDQLRQFYEQFDRSYSSAREDGLGYKWIIWLRDVVIKSLRSSNRVTISYVGQLLSVTEDHSFGQLLHTTLSSRPHQWIDDLLIGSVIKSACTMYEDPTLETAESDLRIFIKRLQGPAKKLLYVLRDQLDDEEELKLKRNEKDLESFKQLLAILKTLEEVPDTLIYRFKWLPLSRWPKRVRHLQLSQQWSKSLANRLTKLDCRFGANKTDRFLELFVQRNQSDTIDDKRKKLNAILKHLFQYTWLFEEFDTMMSAETSDSEGQNRIWNLLQNEQAIKDEMTRSESSSDLKDWEIVRKLGNDQLDEKLLLDQMKRIKEQREAGQLKVDKWLDGIKDGKETMDVVTFLSVACIVVKAMEKYYLRDTQLVAVLILAGSSDRKISCMAEIATGEGKTLITALLAIYLSLSGRSKNGTGCVNVVTSSPVLAEENVAAVAKLFQKFRISVGNNCDQECSEDEDVRRERYKNDVIYGDLSSFQRDELIIRFFGRDVTRNRKADAVIVDEVDSMLLDKGENILYLSHKIPELDDLLQVFVEIWQSIHAPDIMAKFVAGQFSADGKEKAVDLVVTHIRKRIKDAEIIVPVCLCDFVDRQLSIWTASALRAKYFVTTDDSYKLDDLRDGRGQQLVIMDKETGVEQVQMHWSHGLHQFLQLKHSLKLSPISLKAVFMSNISYFNEFKGRLFGLTGTLGSQAECRLLHDVFDVTFLKMPRFKRRFCSELDPLLAPTEDQWLDNVKQATFQQLDEKRSVLIVCENIAAVQLIVKKLQNSKKDQDTNKIRAYTSSFDKEFQKEQLDKKLEPGEVIVATNLAGRGTDLKISQQLEENGGLHVIISYVPANARVEAQAQGRTARAGQPGTYQFVVCCEIDQSYKKQGDEDDEAIAASELQRLKEERDEREAIRLERLGTRGLDKIKLEEKLFERYRLEIHGPAIKEMQNQDLKEKEQYIKHQLDFLTNKWALWLDGNSRDIEDAQSNDQRQSISNRFDIFKKKSLQSASCQSVIKFASTPSELVELGRHFSELKDWYAASQCFQQVIDEEPNNCESALIHQTHKILQKQDKADEKLEAKRLLVKAKLLMQRKIEVLSSSSDIVKLVVQLSRKSVSKNNANETRFDEQVKNLISLYNIHIMAIDDILGRSIRRSIKLQFSKAEEAEALYNLLVDKTNLCKGTRLSRKLDTDENNMILTDQSKKRKKIEWPSMWSYCQAKIVELIQKKVKSKSYYIKQDSFHGVVVTQKQLWNILKKENWLKKQIKAPENYDITLPNEFLRCKPILIDYLKKQNGQAFDKDSVQKLLTLTEEQAGVLATFLEKQGVIVQEVASREWLIKVSEEADIDLPTELSHRKSLVIDYLKKHNNQKFVRESVQELFELDIKQMDSLVKILEEKGFIQHVETCLAIINKEAACVEQLPKNLERFQETLSAWLQNEAGQESEIIVYRDTLPLPKDVQEGGRQIWNYLIGEGIIKEPTLIFPKIAYASEDKIKSRLDDVKKVINGLTGIETLCRKYAPAPPEAADDYEPGFCDVLSYLRAKPWIPLKYGLLGSVMVLDPGLAISILKEERANIKAWLKETKEKAALEAYVNQVVTAVTGSAGQLKTFPASVSASFRNLGLYFTSGRYPPEVDDFEVQLMERVIVLKEYKSWWDWQAFTVAMIGVLQIAAGVAINFISAGVLSPIGTALIAEGINDIMFAIQTGLTGTFSWSAYGKQKMISVGITILTAGLATYLTWSTAVAKTAMAGFRARCGLTMLLAAGKKILCKIGQAARSALIALGVEKLMAYLKKLIVENILEYFRSSLIGVAAMGAVGKLTEAMDKIWKSTGGNVEESKRVIRTTVLVDAAASDMHSTWLNQLSAHSTQLGRAMGNTFAESSRELKFQNGFLDGVGKAQLDAGNSTGLDALNLAKDVLDVGNKVTKIVEASKSAMKWIERLKTGAEVATIITHTPEYIHNIGRQLENQAHSLEMKKESNDSHNIPEESEEFKNFKSEMTAKVERDVLEHVISRINSAWLQPLVQRKVEGAIKSVGKQAVQLIGSLFEDDQDGLGEQRQRVGKDEAEKNKKASSKNNRKKNRSKKRNDGSILHDPPPDESYDEQVNKIGQGETAGLLEFQQTADYSEVPIDIDDPTGTFTANSKDGKFTIKSNGREPKANAPRMHLKVSQNDDGTKHVSLTDSNGKTIYEGSPDGLNRCLYEAAANYKGVSTEEFLTGLKAHALNNDRARYLFERGVGKAMPEARVGAIKNNNNNNNLVKNNTTYEEISVYCEKTDSFVMKKRPVRSDVWIRPENLGQGTPTDDNVRGPSKEENKTSPYINQAGHFAPKSAGGSGTNPDNIYTQDKHFNQVQNNKFDNLWKSDLKTNPNLRVRLIHELAYDNASSMKSDRVTITARIYSSDEFGKLTRRGTYRQTFNNFHRKSLNDLPIRRALNEELNKRFKPA